MTKETMYSDEFIVKEKKLYVKTKKGKINLLCNFLPRITKQISYDDGTEVTNKLVLVGEHCNGFTLPEITIPAEELSKTNWLLKNWDASCIIEVGSNNKDYVRKAIQTTAEHSIKEIVFACTGWREIDGEWYFLMPQMKNYDVELDGKLQNYFIETTKDKYISVLTNMLELEIAPPSVMYPLLSDVFLSPLNSFLKNVNCEPKGITALVGKTGTRKSTLSALMLSFYGNFSASTLPLSFRDTQNSIIHNSYSLKDMLTVIDDFHPTSNTETKTLNTTAQTIARAYGDRVGRGRLKADATQNQLRYPQGNAIITAEFNPNIGESGSARMFAIEINSQSIDLDNLSLFQEQATKGELRKTMYWYLDWLKTKYLQTTESKIKFEENLKILFEKTRTEFQNRITKNVHGRIPEMATHKFIGFKFMLQFLLDHNLITEKRKAELEEVNAQLLVDISTKQSELVEEDNPVQKFIVKLSSLIQTGGVTLLPRGDKTVQENLPNNFIGYADENFFYLDKEVTYKHVKKLCDDQGEGFSITSKNLVKALADEEFIELGYQNEKMKMIKLSGGISKRFLVLKKEKINLLYCF